MLKFTSRMFSNLEKDYRKTCMERRKVLEEFLCSIVLIERNYKDMDFINFFASE